MTMNPKSTPHRHHRPIRQPAMLRLLAVIIASCLLLLPADTNAFAAWFVDRRVSCFTDLAADEIIMNNGVVPHSSSREPSIRLEVSPLGKDDTASPNSEYVVKFILPEEAKANGVADVQYVLELVDPSKADPPNPPGKFTTAPPGGGIGCEGRRSHGKAGSDSVAIFTINEGATSGAKLEIVAGWATGHESVTLTDKVTLVVGEGIVGNEAGSGGEAEYVADDDSLQDDEAEAELEEAFIEEEREELENEIEEAEEDAVEALEEKRQQIDGDKSGINEAEEEVVEALEEQKEEIDQAFTDLKEKIMAKQEERFKDKHNMQHAHDAAKRLEAQRKHREEHDRKQVEDKMVEMRKRFKQKNDDRKDRLDELIDMKKGIKESITKLKKVDTKEHDRARKAHIQPLPRAELKVDMEELKQKAKEKMHEFSDKMGDISDKMGVHELMNDPHMKKIRKNLIRGGEAEYHGDKGRPLPPEGRHFLEVMFTLFILVGMIRYYLDKRRRAMKGRRKE